MSPLVLGVLNTTPDSFSDGHRFTDIDVAVQRGVELTHLGADIIDVGGESTRPGADEVGAAEEQRRTIPVVRELAARRIDVSIDTIRASTAESAVLAGARYVNDVSGGLFDPAMHDTVARLTANIDGVHYIAGHWRGFPDPDHSRSEYDDVVTEVIRALDNAAKHAIDAGIPAENIILDPGLGFDKTAEQCWEVLRRIDELQALGYPVLIGASRKRMLADIAGEGSAPTDRDLATSVITALCARAGLWGVRVHDVAGSAQALAVERAWGRADALGARLTADPAPAPAAPVRAALGEHRDALTTISLTGLEVFAHHGVFDFERETGQPFIVDVAVRVDTSHTRDDIGATVHYGELAEAVASGVAKDPVDLIETVAERVAGIALEFHGVVEATVTVHKPEAPIEVPFADVSVTITRSARDGRGQ